MIGTRRVHVLFGVVGLALAVLFSSGLAQTLRASHQWPQGDIRDQMVRLIKEEVEAADVGLTIQIYPGSSLMGAREQWDGLVRGQLDISAFPLDYASGRHAEFSATLMPGLVKNYDHARRLDDSEFMARIHEIINEAGVMVLANTWLAGGFSSTGQCITSPEDVDGMTMRAAGPYFESMLADAGASIVSMPSSEAYSALQTGVIDALNTSAASFLSYRIYEQVACHTPAGENALWFMYEPILMSIESFESLDEEQQQALLAAGQVAEDYAYEAAKGLEEELVSTFEEAGVEIARMTQEDWQAWIDVAEEASYEEFAANVPNGAELLELARSVE